MYSIYKHTCPNGKIYIGITSQEPERRWCGGFGYQKNSRFFRDIVALGWDNILHEVIAKVETYEEASRIEKILITSHNTTDPTYGYNAQCGSLAQTPSTEPIHIDHAQTPLHTDTTTETFPQKVNRRGQTSKLKVAQYTREGKLIAVFNSMKEASCITGVNHGDICSCCKGQKGCGGVSKRTAGGYIWKYIDENGEV